ncbi:MAG: 2Fe-2S iron-sulfur cluster binding domain-containing protein [Spirochaetes bacterium]|nr:2Fe-2S iron-sulfur cluster binding domain-containing protein [Spirochaetota bacterium]
MFYFLIIQAEFYNLLKNILIISTFTSILTLIIIIIDSTVGNYGIKKIIINNKKTLEVEGGKSLLASLTSNNIFIPSACGGKGACGLCKIKLLSPKNTTILPTEVPWLSKDEINQNIRLSCQFKVKEDLEIFIPEEFFNIKKFEVEVVEIFDLTYDIKGLKLKLLNPDKIEFKAGQFIQIEVPPYELSENTVYRAYSISSEPYEYNNIELMIRYVKNGICTTYIHKYLKVGDKLTINGPYGEFYLRETDSDIVFIAGGSGMAPIKSIILDMIRKNITHRKSLFIFGARTTKDLFLIEYFKEIEKKLPNFTFIPIVSEPKPEEDWKGETGLVTDAVKKYIKDTSNLEAYLCGSPGMIDACVKLLTSMGLDINKIYYDKFA